MIFETTVCGSLSILIGPMFAGKSTLLNAQLIKENTLGAKVLKIIHSADRQRRGTASNNIDQGTSHNPSFTFLPEEIAVVSTDELKKVDVQQYQFIGIDEGQFFGDLLEVVDWVDRLGKNVIVAGLDGDTNKKPFGQLLYLIPHADKVTKVNANCKSCISEQQKLGLHYNINSYEAPFTKRLSECTDQILIGGAEAFQATCRYHHQK